jgi:phosphohistidine phosphatase SixA
MLLLRHASAGERLSDASLDAGRGLDLVGRAQAAWLPQMLSAYWVDRIVSSPLRRCVETVVPLARQLGLDVEECAELEPDASKRSALSLLRGLPATTLACTHREVLDLLFDGRVECEKGGVWLVDRHRRAFEPTNYIAPLEVARTARRVALAAP